MSAEIPLLNLSTRLNEWQQFAEDVHNHIISYAVPQYGDKGSDPASEYSVEQLAALGAKYFRRACTNQRGEQEVIRDMLKAAHIACMLACKVYEQQEKMLTDVEDEYAS